MTQNEIFQDLPLEEVIGDRFGRYSKYIIQDRALPDARDGLKPVQRRILYAMFMDNNTNDKPFRKSAKTVGNVIANYHPHGDSSVYDAMVRMSQDWKARHMLIEMHGNNGSVDGDSPAAMRYTEARLSSISSEMLRDLQKETVDFVPNFDDQDMEPTVLPARYPNLLVNGSTGISAGYATDIPPHALHEVIDGVLMRLKNSEATVDQLMKVVSGPDFPTGGIIQGVAGIKKAYETGRGKIVVRSKTRIEKLKGSKEQIVVDEIPYEVNKANLVKRIDELRVEKKLDGIAEVRDESDRQGLRIVVEMRRDMPAEPILQFLFKNSDLQITYNFNMIAIYKRRPTMMSLPMMLDAYIDHQKEIITKRSQFDLRKAHARLHIVEGLMKALSILDEVIKSIRSSTDKKNAKENLQSKFDFTEIQSEAIVSLQLYRLTNTDITELREEKAQLEATVEELEGILADENVLIDVLKKELLDIRKRFKQDRRSQIQDEISEIKVNMDVLIPSEDVIVSVTKDGYIKRTSQRSHKSSNGQGFAMKDSDEILFKEQLNTQQHLLLFTSKGHYIFQPVYELPDIRWKDLGQHISSIVTLDGEERIINAVGITDFNAPLHVLTVTNNGQIKRSELKEYFVTRYNKPFKAMNLKKEDELFYADVIAEDNDVILTTYLSFALRFPVAEVPATSVRTAGIKAVNLKEEDKVAAVNIVAPEDKGDLLVISQRGSVKRMSISEFEHTGRAKRGTQILREQKANPYRIYDIRPIKVTDQIEIETEKGIVEEIEAKNIRKADRHSNGSLVITTETDGDIRRVTIFPAED